MKKSNSTVLFLGKSDDEYCEKAVAQCKEYFASVEYYCGDWGDPLPLELDKWRGDYIISYLSRWIIPERILTNAKRTALNFHPASPAYPGIGCINFALYDEVKEYGVTCHSMNEKVDTGKIFKVKVFPIFSNDTVDTLLERTYVKQFELFSEILVYLINNESLPECDFSWTREPFTRNEFNELMRLHCGMNHMELAKRIRATSFGEWQPILEFEGFEFKLIK